MPELVMVFFQVVFSACKVDASTFTKHDGGIYVSSYIVGDSLCSKDVLAVTFSSKAKFARLCEIINVDAYDSLYLMTHKCADECAVGRRFDVEYTFFASDSATVRRRIACRIP